MIVPLLAGAAKTLVISLLSERVVLRVLVMFLELASGMSSKFYQSTELDEGSVKSNPKALENMKIVQTIKTKMKIVPQFHVL